jgi:hypothetical protein
VGWEPSPTQHRGCSRPRASGPRWPTSGVDGRGPGGRYGAPVPSRIAWADGNWGSGGRWGSCGAPIAGHCWPKAGPPRGGVHVVPTAPPPPANSGSRPIPLGGGSCGAFGAPTPTSFWPYAGTLGGGGLGEAHGAPAPCWFWVWRLSHALHCVGTPGGWRGLGGRCGAPTPSHGFSATRDSGPRGQCRPSNWVRLCFSDWDCPRGIGCSAWTC